MAFVWSYWYIVMIVLVAAIVASVIIFIKMDRKDKVLIDEFVKASQAEQESVTEKPEEAVATETSTEIKE